ncbi:hypothetical protein DSECCO2_626830 [anaerobic digester metagenome]
MRFCITDQLKNTFLHLACRLVRKSQRQNVIRLNTALNQISHAVSEYACFSRSGTCQNHDRTFGAGHCIALYVIQIIDK